MTLMKQEEYYKLLEKQFPKKYEIRRISTDCETIDLMLGGGVPRRRVTGIYGTTNVGKTWLCYQIAANFCRNHPDQTVLYMDVEAFWEDEDIILFQEYFKARWDIPEDQALPILFEVTYDIYTMFDFLGMKATLKRGDKITASIEFKRDEIVEKKYTDKAGRERTKKIKKGEHSHVFESEMYKFIKKNNVGLVIVDAVTQPFKEIFTVSRQQDFPARSDLMNPLLGTLRALAIIEDIPVVCAFHLTYDMKGRGFTYRTQKSSRPWGGDDVIFHVKSIIGVLEMANEDKGTYAKVVENPDQLRWIFRYRVPGRMQELAPVYLKENTGFVDVEYQSGREGKG